MMYSKENVDEKKRNQNEYDIYNFLILIFQNKEFEEDLDFFDEQNEEDEDNEDREYNFLRDKSLALIKLSTYSCKLNSNVPNKAKLEIKTTNSKLDNVVNKVKEKLSNCEELNKDNIDMIYDNCVAEMVKIFIAPNTEEEKFEDLSYRVKLEELSFKSSWVITVLGIVQFLIYISKTENKNNKNKVLFDPLWFEDFKEDFKTCKDVLAKKSKEMTEDPDLFTELEHKKFINETYSKVIETKPKLIKIKSEEIPVVITNENSKILLKLIKRASKSKINLIRNFPNTIVSKGISCFAENIRNINNKDSLKSFKLEDRILVFFETEEKIEKSKLKGFMKEAEIYCQAEIYSYTVFTTLKYEVISIEEFCKRKFNQALFAVCEISTCKSEFMMPVVRPKLLVYLEKDDEEDEEDKDNKSSKKKKSKKNQSDSESDDEKKKKKKGKKNESNSDDEEEKVSSKNKSKSKKKNKKSDSSDDEDDKKNKKKKGKGSDSDESDKKKGKKGKKNESDSEDSDDGKKNKSKKKQKNKEKSEDSDSEEDTKNKKKNDKKNKKSNKKKSSDSD